MPNTAFVGTPECNSLKHTRNIIRSTKRVLSTTNYIGKSEQKHIVNTTVFSLRVIRVYEKQKNGLFPGAFRSQEEIIIKSQLSDRRDPRRGTSSLCFTRFNGITKTAFTCFVE